MKITYRSDAPLVQAAAFAGDTPYLVERGQTIDVPDAAAQELLGNPHFVAADDLAGEDRSPAAHAEPAGEPESGHDDHF